MKVQKTDISPTNFKLVVTAEPSDLEPIKKDVLKHMSKGVRVQGFRPGKAPLNLIEKNIDQNAYQQHFLDDALNILYSQALRQERIRAVGQPQVNLTKFVPFTELEFTAEVEAVGRLELPDYTKIKLDKQLPKVTEKDIDGVIDSLRLRMAEKKEVERAAKVGDEVWIDFDGKDGKGNPVSGASGKDYPLSLGSNTFIPGFEENLVGLKAGDSKTFDVTFPGDYGVSSLQNQKVAFTIIVNKVNEVVKPELNDAFAAKAGPVKTVADLRADIKTQLDMERQRQADRDFENELIRLIAGQTKVDIPAKMIDDQVIALEEDEKRNLVYRGQTWQEHLEAEGITEDEHRLRHRPQAEDMVKGGLVLGEIAEKEGITVTPEELEIRIQVLKGQYQDKAMQAELDKPENRQDIYNRLMTEKTIAKLVSYTKSN